MCMHSQPRDFNRRKIKRYFQMRYHRSPKTGTYQICRAKNKCPYGGFHTESLAEIIEYCNQYNDILNMPIEKKQRIGRT